MKDKLDVKYTLEDSNGNKYTILDTQRVDLQEELNKEIEKQAKEIERLKEEYVMLQNASDEVEEELQQRIDKAIEYIEKNSYTTIETIDDINYFIVRLDKCTDLLDILKGVDKE